MTGQDEYEEEEQEEEEEPDENEDQARFPQCAVGSSTPTR